MNFMNQPKFQRSTFKAQEEVIFRLVQFQERLVDETDGLYGEMDPDNFSHFVQNYFQRVPGYDKISKKDRMTLLMEHKKEVQMICHLLDQCATSPLPSRDFCRSEFLRRFENCSPEDADAVAEATVDVAKRLRDLALSEKEGALLIALVMFTECRGLEKRRGVREAQRYVLRALRAHNHVHQPQHKCRPERIISLKDALMVITDMIKRAREVVYDLETVDGITMDFSDPISRLERNRLQRYGLQRYRLQRQCQDCENIEPESEEDKRQRYWRLCDVDQEDISGILKFIEEKLIKNNLISLNDKKRLAVEHFKEMALFQCTRKYSSTSQAGRLIERRPADFESSTVEDHLLDFLERTSNLQLGSDTCDMLLATVLFTPCPGLEESLDFVKELHFHHSMLLRSHSLKWNVLPMSELHTLLYNLRSIAGRMGHPPTTTT